MTLPKISVITVSFNQGPFIRQTIESVLNQRYPNFEHIVVDGGSTDETVSILKEYPHLRWTSEPDRGQTHALNKGFSRATGDIIAWLNSDDWYADGVFFEVAEALKSTPIVMGMCEKTDRNGTPYEQTENRERTWWDLLKYWVYNSIPDQPAIFFRRELLDAVRYREGTWLDESLEFTMDYDLWARLARIHPLTARIPRTLAYYRMYEENKTGRDMAGAYREMSRVFSRYANREVGAERAFSFLVSSDSPDDPIVPTLDSIAAQSLTSIETVVVTACDASIARRVRKRILELGERYPSIGLRFVHCGAERSLLSAVSAPLFARLRAGMTVVPDFALSATRLFKMDPLALSLALGDLPVKAAAFSTGNGPGFRYESLFDNHALDPWFIGRTIAFRELEAGGVGADAHLRSIILGLAMKGWTVDCGASIGFGNRPLSDRQADEYQSMVAPWQIAKGVLDASALVQGDSFYPLRTKHGFSFELPQHLLEQARSLAANAPSGWEHFTRTTPRATLEAAARTHPQFQPVWYLLMRLGEEARDGELVQEALRHLPPPDTSGAQR